MDSQNIENSRVNAHNKTKLEFHVNCSYFNNEYKGFKSKLVWVPFGDFESV